ncbi:DUF6114 domain-containing protein [Streptomyces sp. A012304]|uniref:DUF6114 domain-containing protein n=1 Tax=Streptomyces sp. A012304 TaxID=375446 RepID=UPI00223197A1|nr:DUF6114 domain-containing protein [Streptomyces sp. A012304]GKQ39923.1 hypothetical protein ALMP_64500 [Streptomyces sp. A012304]
MSAETPVQSAGSFARLRLRFRDWRGTRPFWAGLFTLLGGVPIAYFPYATLKLGTMSIAMSTTAGAGSLIIGVLLITLGLTMWFQQATRVFAGIASILLALVSLVVANIGGFIVGFLLALIGGALALSWVPGKPAAEGAVPQGAEPAPTTDGVPDPAPRAVAGEPVAPQPWNERAEGGDPHADEAKEPNGVHRVG